MGNIRYIADKLLKESYGNDAAFRKGQYEAIEATLNNKRTLVVQKTGWGKSLVYFITTKIMRQEGKGVTLVISPLLVLMENQEEAAQKLGLKCRSLNSRVGKEEKELIIQEIISNEIDVVFITPETLFSSIFLENVKNIKIGLFVIDEAHCISDWGHDFRLQYGNIYKILKLISSNVPVLATTATANDRVISDLKMQLGNNVFVSRGELLRENLAIQILNLPDIDSRYAWILENINNLPGSGIIYCLTQRDCENLAKFLNQNGISAKAYYSRGSAEEYLNKEAEELFLKNKIKVIVATIKLGMGYDKGDVSFIIHFQQPSNVVSYYQQIGRAGRNIKKAYTFLMTGREDIQIQDYFINSAFPTEREFRVVIDSIFSNTDTGIRISELLHKVNLKQNRLEKVLMFLENDGYIVKDNSKYYSTTKSFYYDVEHYNEINKVRKHEQKQMKEFTETKECYNKFIVNSLDDRTSKKCGVCKNCLGFEEFSSSIKSTNLEKAHKFLEKLSFCIEPRKQWALTSITKRTKIEKINEKGICLSKYGIYKYGRMVKEDKYSGNNIFRDELVEKSYEILDSFLKENNIQVITSVPSLRSNIVDDFAYRLAKKCKLSYVKILGKREALQQKKMQNSSYQCENALNSFYFLPGEKILGNVLLVDDMVDSKWTLTVCGDLLIKNGADKVFPFALADTSNRGDE